MERTMWYEGPCDITGQKLLLLREMMPYCHDIWIPVSLSLVFLHRASMTVLFLIHCRNTSLAIPLSSDRKEIALRLLYNMLEPRIFLQTKTSYALYVDVVECLTQFFLIVSEFPDDVAKEAFSRMYALFWDPALLSYTLSYLHRRRVWTACERVLGLYLMQYVVETLPDTDILGFYTVFMEKTCTLTGGTHHAFSLSDGAKQKLRRLLQ
jgi:hypothetical protein